MDFLNDPVNLMTLTTWFITFIMDATETAPMLEGADANDLRLPSLLNDTLVLSRLSLMSNTLQQFRLCDPPFPMSDEIGYWVKPRSTTWFSQFLLEQYDDSRWLSMFRMTKACVFELADLLEPYVKKKNTKYRVAVPVLIRVAVTLFKLAHGANFTVCSEVFAIGRSTVCKILREVVHAINDTLKCEVGWPNPARQRRNQIQFEEICSLPAVLGAIDGMQIGISKPDHSPADYYYFKSGAYSMNCQAVVDADKRFIDLYIGMPGSTNDSRMLRRSTLHYDASHGNLMTPALSVDGHTPYLVGDLGYPLLPWLMVPHRGSRNLSVSEKLFNKKLRAGRCVVENAFGILKQCFRELSQTSHLHLGFLPDVILCCAILHNILLGQTPTEVEHLLSVLRSEGLRSDDSVEEAPEEFRNLNAPQDSANTTARLKRQNLGVFLSTRRRPT